MLEFDLVRAWVATTRHKLTRAAVARRRGDDVGASIVETVIIVGLFAAAAIIIIGILVAKATDAANAVKTQ